MYLYILGFILKKCIHPSTSGTLKIEAELILNLTPWIGGLQLYKLPPPSIIERANPVWIGHTDGPTEGQNER